MKGLNLADTRLLGWLAIALAIGGLLYLLSPILAPFLAGAILAYILNPLVARITGSSVRRTIAVVFVLFLALLAVVAVLLIPVVLFYLLRDWKQVLARIDALLPRHLHAQTRRIFREIDAVLAEFLRGQMLVMLVMAVYYVTALWLAKLQFALPIGLLTGLLVFIPYVGAVTGFVLATIAALLQFGSLGEMAWVWVAFGLGQMLEGTVVTPVLVGERIGLHPVAVIFALLAFGSLFGFFGVLLALPASAALLVALRHVRAAYLASPLYGGKQ